MVNATTLQHLIATAMFQLTTDASATHIRATLFQKEDYNKGWSLVAIYSKTLSLAEPNYSIYNQELLAAVWGVKKFCHFIEGGPFTLKSDHKLL